MFLLGAGGGKYRLLVCWSRFVKRLFLVFFFRICKPQNHHQISVSFQFRFPLSVLLIKESLHFQNCHMLFHLFSFLAPATLLVKSSLTVFIITYVMTKVKSYFYFFRNLFTKYCCPFPVTSTVFVIRTLPSGLLSVLSLISNNPASMLLCVGIL